MTWYDDAGHGDAKGHALRTGDYVDPRDALPTLAECQRDEAESDYWWQQRLADAEYVAPAEARP